jgi:hypothetical protein
LDLAIMNENLPAFLYLVEAFAGEITKLYGNMRMMLFVWAVRGNFINLYNIAALLDQGWSTDIERIKTFNMSTLMHLAVRFNSLVALKLLITKNATNSSNKDGRSPLDYVIASRNKLALDILCEAFPHSIEQLDLEHKILMLTWATECAFLHTCNLKTILDDDLTLYLLHVAAFQIQ